MPERFFAYAHDVALIRERGFVDQDWDAPMDGVLLTDRPDNAMVNCSVLVVELDEDISDREMRFESDSDDKASQPHRSWIVPAEIVNRGQWRRATPADVY